MSGFIIETHDLTRRFGTFTAVDHLALRVEENTVHGFLGPNGSGKTTAIRMMCGLLDPSEGSVQVLGMHVPEEAAAVRRHVGYMTQRFSMYEDMTVRQNLEFLGRVHGIGRKERRTRIAEMLEEFRLDEIEHRFAGPLSGGQKRRLALAGAVMTRPQLLILDEPTSEVDPNTRREMWESFFRIASKGTSILVTTHLMDEAERCHNLTIMNHGRKVADGSVETLKTGLQAKVTEVSGPDVAAITAPVKALPETISVAQSGNELRVIFRDSTPDPQAVLRAAVGDAYTMKAVEVRIEDVFVVNTDGRGA